VEDAWKRALFLAGVQAAYARQLQHVSIRLQGYKRFRSQSAGLQWASVFFFGRRNIHTDRGCPSTGWLPVCRKAYRVTVTFFFIDGKRTL